MNLRTMTARQKLTIGVASVVAVGALYAAAAITGQPEDEKTPPVAAEVEHSSTPEPAPVAPAGDEIVDDVPADTPVDNGDEPASSDGAKAPVQPAPQTPVKPAPPAPAPKPASPAPVPPAPQPPAPVTPPPPPQIPAKAAILGGIFVPFAQCDYTFHHSHTVGWGGTSLDSQSFSPDLPWSYTVDGPTVTYYVC